MYTIFFLNFSKLNYTGNLLLRLKVTIVLYTNTLIHINHFIITLYLYIFINYKRAIMSKCIKVIFAKFSLVNIFLTIMDTVPVF